MIVQYPRRWLGIVAVAVATAMLAGLLLVGTEIAEGKKPRPPTLKKGQVQKAVNGVLSNWDNPLFSNAPDLNLINYGSSNCRKISRTKGTCDAFFTQSLGHDGLNQLSRRCDFPTIVSTKKLRGGQLFVYPLVVDTPDDPVFYVKVPFDVIPCGVPFSDNDFNGIPD